jgi:hypothetical protein
MINNKVDANWSELKGKAKRQPSKMHLHYQLSQNEKIVGLDISGQNLNIVKKNIVFKKTQNLQGNLESQDNNEVRCLTEFLMKRYNELL